MSFTTDIVPGRSIIGPKSETKLDGIVGVVTANVNESTGRPLTALTALNLWDGDDTGELGNLSAKKNEIKHDRGPWGWYEHYTLLFYNQ